MHDQPKPFSLERRGVMMVLSSPSGVGKTSLTRALLAYDDHLSLSISVTTRPPRPGEKDGFHYFFITKERYDEMVDNNELLEHAKVFGHYYGTPKPWVMQQLEKGRDILFDIDWQGTEQLMENSGVDVIRVFLLPPSVEILESRLTSRAQDTNAVVTARMAKADEEMSHYSEYDWVLVNDDLDHTLGQLCHILESERLRRHRQLGLGEFVKTLRDGAKKHREAT